MSGLELPMGFLDRLVRRSSETVGLDDAMLLRLERAVRRVQPDPLFERRLRGHVVNRYVAAREGLLSEPRPRRQMGRLGRSVLYASVVLALSVSAVGAAAQESIPGDPLYGVKLRLEDVRMHVAPASARAELAEIALAERADELERLAAAGAWRLVPAAATRLTEARQELIELDPTARERAASGQLGAVDVLEAVLAEAPPAARAGLEQALQAVRPPASTGGEETGAGQSPQRPDSATPGSSGQPSRQGGAPGATDNRNPRADDAGRPPDAPANDSSQGGGAQGSQKAPDAPGKGGGQSGQGQSGQGDQRGGPPASPLS